MLSQSKSGKLMQAQMLRKIAPLRPDYQRNMSARRIVSNLKVEAPT